VFSDQDTRESDDVEVGILTVSEGTLSYNTLADGSNGESVDPANIVMQPLSGGGVVTVVGFSWTEDGSPSYEVIQTYAAGEVIGETLLTEGQVCGLGINNDVHGIEADISEVGDLELYLTSDAPGSTERFESKKIMFDLLPDQSGEPEIALAEVANGEDIDGTFGDDVMRGTPLNDDISGKSGDDVIHGDAGADHITGGINYYTIFGGDGNDYISGDGGFDALLGGAGSDDLYGGLGKDDIRGGDGNDYRSDVAWHDFLPGNHGNDEMFGGDGKDDMNGDDVVYGDSGNDKVSGFDGDDTLFGGDGQDVMHGGRGDDVMNGGAGDDVLRGAHGDYTLSRDGGDDLLIGGAGADVYTFDLLGEQSFGTQGSDDEGPDSDEF
jgi:Ca2+-binding RTX toxin-like protein